MKKPTKEQVKGFGVKSVVASIMTGQSIAAGKFVTANWKKDKKKSIAFAAGSALINIGLLASENIIEKKVCALRTAKKEKAEEPKAPTAGNNE